jgi:hypothetical protein
MARDNALSARLARPGRLDGEEGGRPVMTAGLGKQSGLAGGALARY